MFVGIIQVELEIPESFSLKDKRRVVRSLKERLRRRHRVAVAEVGILDDRREATLGIAVVGNEAPFVQRCCQVILNEIEGSADVKVTDSQVEIL